MEDFKFKGYAVEIIYNDYDYIQFFIADETRRLDIKESIIKKLKGIKNCSSTYNATAIEVYTIVNKSYNKFAAKNNKIKDYIFALSTHYTINTPPEDVPSFQQQYEKIKKYIDAIVYPCNNLSLQNISKSIDLLQNLASAQRIKNATNN